MSRPTPLANPVHGSVEGTAPFDPPLLVHVEEAARLLGIGRTLCWQMVRRGELQSVKIHGRVLIPRWALETVAGVATVSPATGDAPRPRLVEPSR